MNQSVKDSEVLCDRLVKWIKDQVRGAGLKGTVFGISGGIDSAVTGALCKRAFPDTCLGLIMPCHSDPNDQRDAFRVAETFRIPYQVVVLDDVYDRLIRLLDRSPNKAAEANIKPRLRMIVLYYYAAARSSLVVGTGNKSELTVGYFTKYGDGGVDILPLGNLVKEQVRALAEYLRVPAEIIQKPPTAGLWQGQTDEGEMGLTYCELDRFILTGEAEPAVKEKVMTLHRRSEHKRALPPVPPF